VGKLRNPTTIQKPWQGEKRMKRTLLATLSTLLVVGSAISALAAPAIKVDCNKGGSIGATLAHLAQIGSTRGITILVSGTCNENITISGFDHLVLKSLTQGTTLQDVSNGNNTVVAVWSSNDVTLEDFTIIGGLTGVWCGGGSLCKLNSNTIQQSAGSGVSVEASTLYMAGNSILNNAGFGVDAESGSNVVSSSNTVTGNFRGFTIFAASNLSASGDIVQQNNETGIVVVHKSFLRAINVTINNNKADGVFVEGSSTAKFAGGNVATGNSINGVSVNDLSFGEFVGANTVTGNSVAPDVGCFGQFPVVQGASTIGGTTNCK
jgi:hypothetical protein